MATKPQKAAPEPSLLDSMDIDEAKRQKAVEEVKRLKLTNSIASRELCHRKQVLEVVMPIVSRIIDDITTLPDLVSSELAGQDVGTIHERLRQWGADTAKKYAESLTIDG